MRWCFQSVVVSYPLLEIAHAVSTNSVTSAIVSVYCKSLCVLDRGLPNAFLDFYIVVPSLSLSETTFQE